MDTKQSIGQNLERRRDFHLVLHQTCPTNGVHLTLMKSLTRAFIMLSPWTAPISTDPFRPSRMLVFRSATAPGTKPTCVVRA